MSSSITDYLYPSRQASYAEQQNRMVNATERLRDDSEASTERLRQSLFAVSGATGNDGLISGPAGSRIKNFLAMLEEYMAGASAGSEKTIGCTVQVPCLFPGQACTGQCVRHHPIMVGPAAQ